jgi:hypothetical protein
MTGLERHCRWLLRAYPAWYRRERSDEILGTLLEVSPPGRSWPMFSDARTLIVGSFRVRGWVWLLSMAWVGAGAVYAAYFFFLTTKPFFDPGLGIVGFGEVPGPFEIVIALATVVLYGALFPVLIAGLFRLRGWRRGKRLRAAAWAVVWIVGVAFHVLAAYWEQYPLHSCLNPPGNAVPPQCPYGSPAVVNWGELGICAAWLALGILMSWILAVPPARRSGVPSMRSRASGKTSSHDSTFLEPA